MSEFIDRFLEIRGVIKNVYMQIDEVRNFLEDRSRSLGRQHGESIRHWCILSLQPDTINTWGYEPNDYTAEVFDIVHMHRAVHGCLKFIQEIYEDLMEMLQCNNSPDRGNGPPIGEMDDPNDHLGIMERLDPRVCLDDDVMKDDQYLGCIAQRIYDAIKHGYSSNGKPHLFHIHGKHELYKVLHDNKFSTFQNPHQMCSSIWYT